LGGISTTAQRVCVAVCCMFVACVLQVYYSEEQVEEGMWGKISTIAQRMCVAVCCMCVASVLQVYYSEEEQK